MEIVLIIALIVIVVINNSRLSEKINYTNNAIKELTRLLNESSRPITTEKKEDFSATEKALTDLIKEAETPEPIDEVEEEPIAELKEEIPVTAPFSSSYIQPIQDAADTPEEAPSEKEENIPPTPKPTFMERYPDLEKFVGENLINKIGIGILVLGIGFFVKYAIDQNWINEVARVGIGLLCGGLLIGIAHRMRNTFKAFSSVLVGGGISVFYFTIAIGFHEYQIFGQVPAFIIMVLITGFSVVLSLTYNRMELAILSILGGFSTPFILSTGDGNYVVLFTYLCILNLGMLTLAYYKKWNPINVISYVLTILIFGGWLGAKALQMPSPPYGDIFIFSTIFYIIFFLMNIINNVLSKRKFNSLEISILISNTFLYYSVGMTALNHLGGGHFQGFYTALMGVINFIFAYVLYKRKTVDQNLVFLLIGLVMTFVSLAAPVQLEGNYITLFWAAEAVLLLWLCMKSEIKIMGYASILINILMIISLVMDWQQLYFGNVDGLNIVFNQVFITGAFVMASLLSTRYLISTNKEFSLFENLEADFYSKLISGITLALAYLVGLLEFNFQLDQRLAFYPMRSVILASYHFLFFIGIHLLGRKKENSALIDFSVLLLWIGMISYILIYTSKIIALRNEFLINTPDYIIGFIYHYLDLILILMMAYLSIDLIRKGKSILSQFEPWGLPVISILLLIVFSIELDHIVYWMSYQDGRSMDLVLEQNHKIGFPILWGIYSFGLMWAGMKYKIKHLRINSLLILLVTLLKLFIYDIKDVSEAGKIVAFICLGVLLLVISFMYQKLKTLIIDDEELKA